MSSKAIKSREEYRLLPEYHLCSDSSFDERPKIEPHLVKFAKYNGYPELLSEENNGFLIKDEYFYPVIEYAKQMIEWVKIETILKEIVMDYKEWSPINLNRHLSPEHKVDEKNSRSWNILCKWAKVFEMGEF